MLSAMNSFADEAAETGALLDRLAYPAESSFAAAALQDIQTHFGYLPHSCDALVAHHFGVDAALLAALIADNSLFRRREAPACRLRLCVGPSCSREGADALVARFADAEQLSCMGCCNRAPVAIVDGEMLTSASVVAIAARLARI